MVQWGTGVPDGFIILTGSCIFFKRHGFGWKIKWKRETEKVKECIQERNKTLNWAFKASTLSHSASNKTISWLGEGKTPMEPYNS